MRMLLYIYYSRFEMLIASRLALILFNEHVLLKPANLYRLPRANITDR
jgi:hypothetical protein